MGKGEIKTKVTVQARKVSKSAQEKIEKAGGKVEILIKPGPINMKKKK